VSPESGSTVLYSASMSLDGFIAGPGGDMSWLTPYIGSGPDAGLLMADVGALLVGRRTFDGDDPNAGTDSEGAYGGQWHGPVVVLTHSPPDGANDPDTVFVDDLARAMETAKAAAGGRYVSILGADVARQCLEAGLLDEVLVLVVPVLLGDGTRLFDLPGGMNVPLEPLDPDDTGPLRLWFRVGSNVRH
jgi:dihydrofolate reductase